jgi:hypothetical protein
MSSLKICLISFYLPSQIFDMSQKAVSATIIQNSAQEIFHHKQKGLTLKQLESFYAGYGSNFESKLQTTCQIAEIVQTLATIEEGRTASKSPH